MNDVGALNYILFHDGNCASGWMGDNRRVETVDECAAICSERKGCGYFAYDDTRSYGSYYRNCVTYFESGGCLIDNLLPEYTAYKIVLPEENNSNFLYFHDGHCASGWMGDNRKVETVDGCATICSEREGCGYFAYDDTGYDNNCATYFESDECLDDNLHPEFNAYEIVQPTFPSSSPAPSADELTVGPSSEEPIIEDRSPP